MFDFEIANRETIAYASSHLRLYQFIPRPSAVQEAIDRARTHRRPRPHEPEAQPGNPSKNE